MVLSLGLTFLALRAGLALRRGGAGVDRRSLRRRHLRLAKPALILVLVGFLAGPLSMWLIRDREPFGTAHALAAFLSVGLFVTAGVLGRRLETGRSRARDAHALAGLLAVLAGALSAITGFVLLP